MAAVPAVIRRLQDLKVRLGDLKSNGPNLVFEPDDESRAKIAKTLDLVSLPSLSANLNLSAWLDGAEINGAWTAIVEQTCGVSLDVFQTPLSGEFQIRTVPADSPNAPSAASEVEIDLDATEPPDVLDSEMIDLSAYVVEHLALEIDPFPRKPGAVFEPPEAPPLPSPFAVLKDLKS